MMVRSRNSRVKPTARRGRRRAVQLLAVALVGSFLTVLGPLAPPAGATLNSYSESVTASCGAWQTMTVPAGAKEAVVELWGGGGGGGAADAASNRAGKGGSGAKVSVTLANVSTLIGSTLSLVIGCGGGGGDNGAASTGGTSVAGAGGGSGQDAGAGGGATALCVGSSACTTPLVFASGGGGGGGIWRCCIGQNPVGGDGGWAGNGTSTGNNGVNASSASVKGCGGGGASTASNGAAGDGCSSGGPGGAGSGANPGNGGGGAGSGGCTGGGGGGGGYRGGGGAECGDDSGLSEAGGGGGAGSSFVTSSYSPGTATYSQIGYDYTGCGRGTSACTTVSETDAGKGGQCACTNNAGYRGKAGFAKITWKVSYSQVTFTQQPANPQTALTAFGWQVSLKDYQGNTVNSESVGTISATLNPGSGCSATFSTSPSSSYNGTNLITFSGAQIPISCVNTSTITVSVVNPSTGGTAQGISSTFTVNKKAQTVSFTSSNPSPVNAGATYDPTGTATSGLAVGFGVSGPCTYSNPTVSFTGSGTCVVTASQPGDAAWAAATPATQNITVRGLTSTAMSCSPSAITIGVGNQTSTCTVTVTDTSPGPKINPTGTIAVGQAPSGGTLGTGCTTPGLVPSGGDAATCQFTFTTTTPNTYSFSANYTATSSHLNSSVSGVTVAFTNQTSTAIACTPAKTAYNNTATCVVTVTDTGGTPAVPTGTVTYSKTEGDGTENPSPNGSCTLSGISGSAAQCQFTYSSPTKDTYKFSTSYPGDSKHESSGPTVGSFSITNRSTQITGSCSPNIIATGSTTTCTFTVQDTDLEAPGSKVDPAGNVTVSVASGASAQSSSCTLAPDTPLGTSKCSIVFNSGPANGPLKVISMYFQGGTGGDQHRSSAGFTSFNVTGTPISSRRTTSSTISCASTNVPVGSDQNCTVTVTDTDTGSPVTPTGIVNLYTSGGASPSVGTCSLSQQSVGVATCSLNITAQLPKASKATHAFYTGSIVHHTSATPGSYIWYAT